MNKKRMGKMLSDSNYQEQKNSSCTLLVSKGFFDFKDAIPQVATAFKMSEVSIYKYIQIIKMKQMALWIIKTMVI